MNAFERQKYQTYRYFRKTDFFTRYHDFFRYTALTICGFAVGLIFDAAKNYSFSQNVIEKVGKTLVSPLSAGKDAYTIMGDLVYGADSDLIYILVIIISGLSFVCDTVLSSVMLVRGFSLGMRTGVYAVSASSLCSEYCSHPTASAVTVMVFCTIDTVILIFLSSVILRGTETFRLSPVSERSVIFSKNFISAISAALIGYGVTIILNLFQAIILKFICRS